MGVFALAFKKTTGDRDVYLAIENNGRVLGVQVKPRDEARAHRWARAFNSYADDGEVFDDDFETEMHDDDLDGTDA